MDDMWAAFADMGAPHALMVGDEVAGSCVVDADAQLIRFYVVPRFQNESGALLRLALSELESTHMMVFTNDLGTWHAPYSIFTVLAVLLVLAHGAWAALLGRERQA